MLARKRTLISLAALAAFWASPVWPATYFVSKSGSSDVNPCTQAQPCLTIGKAVTLATRPGDIVQVGPGAYNESVTLQAGGSASGGKITVRGHDGSGCPQNVDADPNSRGYRPAPTVSVSGGFDIAANYISLDCFEAPVDISPGGYGFIDLANLYAHDSGALLYTSTTNGGDPTTRAHDVTLKNSYSYMNAFGVVLQCNNCTIQDNEFERQNGTQDNDYSRFFGNTIIFRHNYMHGASYADCQAHGISCHIDCWQTWNVGNPDNQAINITIDRNVCFNSHEGIIAQDYTSTAYGSYSSHYNWTVTNNVFAYGPNDSEPWCADFEHIGNIQAYHNLCATGGGWSYRSGSQGIHKNNIHISANYGTESGGQITSSEQNLIFGGQTWPAQGTDVINRDPLFINASASNFHLQPGSPAIDAGANAGVTLDLDGRVRPQGAGYDIGPYEYAAGSTSSACDVNKDNTTNIVDVQQCVNQSLGVATCTADINKDGICNVVDVQRVVNAALGGQCVSP